jgi:hypothetical protein
MSREKIKAPNRTEHSPLIQERRNRRGCSFVLFVTIALLLVPVIKSLPYTIAHFNATNCGSLSGFSPTGVVADKKEALQDTQCFFSAHQHCEAATLTVNYQYVDSGARVTFRTANSLGQCSLSIIGYSTACRVLFCNFVPYIDDDCITLIQQEDGLHLTHCGSSPQDFPVPT